MPSGMEYIRNYYGVPAKRGMCVLVLGKRGTIVGTSGPHLLIKIDGSPHAGVYHPTDVDYNPGGA